MQQITGDEARKYFPRLRNALVSNDMFDNQTLHNEKYLNNVLEALFVTNPLDNNEPFEVNYANPTLREKVNKLGGKAFKIHYVKVKPQNGSYHIRFHAGGPVNGIRFEFEGVIRPGEPPLTVEKARVYQTRTQRIDVEFFRTE